MAQNYVSLLITPIAHPAADETTTEATFPRNSIKETQYKKCSTTGPQTHLTNAPASCPPTSQLTRIGGPRTGKGGGRFDPPPLSLQPLLNPACE